MFALSVRIIRDNLIGIEAIKKLSQIPQTIEKIEIRGPFVALEIRILLQ